MLESTQRSKVAFPSEYIYHIVCTLSVVAEVIKNLGLKIRNRKLFSPFNFSYTMNENDDNI